MPARARRRLRRSRCPRAECQKRVWRARLAKLSPLLARNPRHLPLASQEPIKPAHSRDPLLFTTSRSGTRLHLRNRDLRTPVHRAANRCALKGLRQRPKKRVNIPAPAQPARVSGFHCMLTRRHPLGGEVIPPHWSMERACDLAAFMGGMGHGRRSYERRLTQPASAKSQRSVIGGGLEGVPPRRSRGACGSDPGDAACYSSLGWRVR